jgi:hypothetical protein
MKNKRHKFHIVNGIPLIHNAGPRTSASKIKLMISKLEICFDDCSN